jgi:hypothetical protein
MSPKPSATPIWSARRRASFGHVAVVACLILTMAVLAAAQVGSLYFREAEKDGRIYVFNSSDRYASWLKTGEMGGGITLAARGPNGETVIGENETAIDLYLFKHDLPAYDRAALPQATPPSLPQVRLGTTMFLSYQDGKSAGTSYSKFVVKRGYLDMNGTLTPFLSFRLTPDVTQDSTGDYKVRLKLGYAHLSTARLGFIAKPYVEAGMIPTPWLDFEERINSYRMQDAHFIDRIGIMASADLGLVVGGLLGGELSADAQKESSSANPGRFGSFALGVYNGGGYTTAEANTNKVLEGRISIRPLPDLVPNLQVSYFGISGKGNTTKAPEWTTSMAALTWECRRIRAVVSHLTGKGNAKGDAVDASTGKALDRKGWSAFVEGKLSPFWSLIARYDDFTPDTRVSRLKQNRTIGGVCYHIAKGYDVLLDHDRLRYAGTTKPDDTRTQLTFQIKL